MGDFCLSECCACLDARVVKHVHDGSWRRRRLWHQVVYQDVFSVFVCACVCERMCACRVCLRVPLQVSLNATRSLWSCAWRQLSWHKRTSCICICKVWRVSATRRGRPTSAFNAGELTLLCGLCAQSIKLWK